MTSTLLIAALLIGVLVETVTSSPIKDQSMETVPLQSDMEEADFPMDYQFLVNQLERFLANEMEGKQRPMDGGSTMDQHEEVGMDGKLKPMDGGSMMDHQHEEMGMDDNQRPMDGASMIDHHHPEMGMDGKQLLMNGEQPVDLMLGEDWSIPPLKDMGLGGIPEETLKLFMEVMASTKRMERYFSDDELMKTNYNLLMMGEAQPQDNAESMDVDVRSRRSRRDILENYYDWWCTQLGWFCGPPTAKPPTIATLPPCQPVPAPRTTAKATTKATTDVPTKVTHMTLPDDAYDVFANDTDLRI